MGTSLPGGTWGSSPRGRWVSDALSLVTHLGSPEQGAGPTRACRFSLDLKRPHALGACPHRALPRGCSLVPVQDGRPRHQGRCCDTASRARPPAVRVTARGGAAALLASPSGAPRQGTECACSDGGARPTWGISRSRSVALPPWAQAAARPGCAHVALSASLPHLGGPESPRGTESQPAGASAPPLAARQDRCCYRRLSQGPTSHVAATSFSCCFSHQSLVPHKLAQWSSCWRLVTPGAEGTISALWGGVTQVCDEQRGGL